VFVAWFTVATLLLTKNPGLFQDFPGLPCIIFQDLFGAHKCLNIKKKWHLLTIVRVQSIAENSA